MKNVHGGWGDDKIKGDNIYYDTVPILEGYVKLPTVPIFLDCVSQ